MFRNQGPHSSRKDPLFSKRGGRGTGRRMCKRQQDGARRQTRQGGYTQALTAAVTVCLRPAQDWVRQNPAPMPNWETTGTCWLLGGKDCWFPFVPKGYPYSCIYGSTPMHIWIAPNLVGLNRAHEVGRGKWLVGEEVEGKEWEWTWPNIMCVHEILKQ